MNAPLRRQYRDHPIRGQLRADEQQWHSTPPPKPVGVPMPRRRRSDRWAAAAWRLHDGMPLVWALLFAVLLIVSGAISVLLLASAFGWQP